MLQFAACDSRRTANQHKSYIRAGCSKRAFCCSLIRTSKHHLVGAIVRRAAARTNRVDKADD